jgi:hypothetical protein
MALQLSPHRAYADNPEPEVVQVIQVTLSMSAPRFYQGCLISNFIILPMRHLTTVRSTTFDRIYLSYLEGYFMTLVGQDSGPAEDTQILRR